MSNEHQQRRLRLRTRGQSHGPITRLASPGDIGELIKPFVFLDRFDADPSNAPRFGFHPHSGIATLTLVFSGQTSYKETTGREGIVDTNGIEWMRAGGGVWHTGSLVGTERVSGFQIWVALPPEMELSDAQSQYLDADSFSSAGPARVILGEYEGHRSAVAAPSGMTLLDVRLRAGEKWRFVPAQGFDVAWLAVHEGSLAAGEEIGAGELAVFEPGAGAIDFEAHGDTRFILGAAIRHPHDLVTGSYSVHTSRAALQQGEANIVQIGHALRSQRLI